MDFVGFLNIVWKTFSDNILTKPEYFISLIVFVGYLVLKRPLHENFAGTLKCIVGILIWNVGATGLVGTFRPILAGLNTRFDLKAAVIDPYFGLAAANKGLADMAANLVTMVVLSLLFAFVWNIILIIFRKVTKIRTLFLTGHVMLQQSTTATFLVFFGCPELRNVYGCILVGMLVGTYQAVFSNLTVDATENLTDGAGFAVGHQQMGAVWLTDKIAGKIGNKDKNLDNIKLPKVLQIFNDNVVATGTLMLIFFGIIMVVLGEPYLRKTDPTNFPPTLAFVGYIVNRALHFAVYLYILQRGIAMFVAELTEAFQGISEKILPGTMPAVDCATVYAFGSQNALIYGFIFGAIGQAIAIAGLFVFHSPILIITGFVPLFFDNATLAVFANKRGGVRAATIIPLICGILQVLGGAIAAWYFGLYKYGGWHGNIDWDTIWPFFGYVINILKIPAVICLIILMLIIPQVQYIKNRKNYFKNQVTDA